MTTHTAPLGVLLDAVESTRIRRDITADSFVARLRFYRQEHPELFAKLEPWLLKLIDENLGRYQEDSAAFEAAEAAYVAAFKEALA